MQAIAISFQRSPLFINIALRKVFTRLDIFGCITQVYYSCSINLIIPNRFCNKKTTKKKTKTKQGSYLQTEISKSLHRPYFKKTVTVYENHAITVHLYTSLHWFHGDSERAKARERE